MTIHDVENTDLWKRILISPIVAFAFAEAFVRWGPFLDFASYLHPFGLINAFESSIDRKNDLAIHFVAQIALLPLDFHLLLRAMQQGTRRLSTQNAAQGLFLSGLMAAFLFVPRTGPRNAPAKRTVFVTPLIEQSNLAYALVDALFVICLALGASMTLAWIQTTRIRKP